MGVNRTLFYDTHRMPNQYTKAAREGLPKPVVSEETRKKLSAATIASHKTRWLDPAYREKISKAMKLAVEKYPHSYGVSNRGRTKRIDAHGLTFQGKWELEFYEYCLKSDIEIYRVTNGFPYEWNGSRTYFPDFYLPALDLHIEVKGYETDRDRAKWMHFPKALKIIKKTEIIAIRKNEFDLLAFIKK